jgi:pyruvate dehydrogenase E1 component
MSCGSIMRQALDAAGMLKADFGISADIWAATSFNELAREAQDVARQNRMHPTDEPKEAFVTRALAQGKGPVIAATDYMKNLAEQIRGFVPHPFHVLGTDGFGRSDSRVNLRRHFEVDANHIAATAVYALFKEGAVTAKDVAAAYDKYGIDPSKPNPRTA